MGKSVNPQCMGPFQEVEEGLERWLSTEELTYCSCRRPTFGFPALLLRSPQPPVTPPLGSPMPASGFQKTVGVSSQTGTAFPSAHLASLATETKFTIRNKKCELPRDGGAHP